jgi:glycosyltransferase involved in cell wall biosynthesis
VLLGSTKGKIDLIMARVPLLRVPIGGSRVCIKQVMTHREQYRFGIISRILKDLFVQFKISYTLVKESKSDAYIFFLCQSLVIPIITLRLMRRKVILSVGASFSELAKSRTDRWLLISKMEEKIGYKLASRIIIYSNILIDKWKISNYKDKISLAHEHFLDFDKFKMLHSLTDRKNMIGYIGRFSAEKGILNFVNAIPLILTERKETNFLIGGDGKLKSKIEQYLTVHNFKEKVNLTGWIPHDDLPQYLNKLKLLVLPSYTEGLPNIMLEAMACGTTILATPMGAIPDFIKDGETGFIMENNSPKCIAKNILRVLNHPNLEQIANNGRALVEKEFTYEKAVEGYRGILNSLFDKHD